MKVLIAGIGNIFLGDDAFGVELAGRLGQRPWPEAVRVIDFGIRSFDLVYALLDGCDVNILLDTTSRGGPPGTLYTIEIDPQAEADLDRPGADTGAHGMNPMRVLHMAQTMGGVTGRVLLVGCEPETFGSEEEGVMGLSATVAAAVEPAVQMVVELVDKLLRDQDSAPGDSAAA